jgi:hypothetical protein
VCPSEPSTVALLHCPDTKIMPPTLASATPSILQDCVENQPSSGVRDGRGRGFKTHLSAIPHATTSQCGTHARIYGPRFVMLTLSPAIWDQSPGKESRAPILPWSLPYAACEFGGSRHIDGLRHPYDKLLPTAIRFIAFKILNSDHYNLERSS